MLHCECAYVAPVHPELTGEVYPCPCISQEKILNKLFFIFMLNEAPSTFGNETLPSTHTLCHPWAKIFVENQAILAQG